MRDKVGKISDIVLMVACTLMVGLYASRSRVTSPSSSETHEYWDNWLEMKRVGIKMGSEKAPVTIVEFADLECPACKATNQRVSEIRAKYGDDVQLVFMHFPLPQHHLAMISSRAIECADVRGRASALMDAVYSKQDSLGLKTWSSFGADAGIDSPSIFGECVAGSQAFPRIEAGLAVGKAAEVHGTPTFFVNGWRIRSDSLDIAVSMLLKGKQPYAKFKTRHL